MELVKDYFGEPKAKIAVIEDDEFMGQFISIFLGERFDVTRFTTVEEFIETINSTSLGFDAIISDLLFKGLKGTDLINIVRLNKNFDDIPLIILSGEINAEVRLKCLKAGADDFVTKPFLPEEIVIRTNNLLKRFQRCS